MKIINAAQGSQEWLDIRAKYFTASEAPAMLGGSQYKTRQALLREKATGHAEDVDASKQRLFDRGHDAEAVARPLAEAIIGEDLFPATVAAEIDGLPLLSSHDGITMDEQTNWENKLDNERLRAMIATGDLDAGYWPQVEQQMAVTGAARTLFTICDGEKITGHLWYESKPERRAQLIAGWKQFAEDLAMYQHVEAAPVAVATPVRDLPILFVQARGEVTSTNMPSFKATVSEFLGSLNFTPKNDQEFADSKAIAAKLREGAKALIAKKAEMLAQTASIGDVASECDAISKQMNAAALALEKEVDREEANRKGRLIQSGQDQFAAHITALEKRIGMRMPAMSADFAKAIKGKSKLESMENGIATELARAKIAANELADKIDANMSRYAEIATGYEFLFRDIEILAVKDADGFEAIVLQRINQHAESERKRLDAERDRIRIEEERKANAKAAAEKAAEDAAREEKNREWRDAQNTTTEPAIAPATRIAETPAPGKRETAPVQPAHQGITGSAKILDEIDDILRGFTLADLIRVRDFAAQVAGQRAKVAA